jgi:TusA-related sulfurtransferase
MKINSETKISALIKKNPESIEAIVSVNPRFKKLRNPLLRGILASRTSLGDAARIGKCNIDELFNALAVIGFEPESNMPDTGETNKDHANPEISKAIQSSKVISLDVRPALESGGDPFSEIMRELLVLPDGYALEVINSFEPTPLIKIAQNKGFDSVVETKDDAVYTYFMKTGKAKEEARSGDLVFKISVDEHEARIARCNKKIRETDVRDLEMPLPMVTILKELEDLEENEALYVHHKKVPQYLLPELAERNFKTWIAEVDEYNVKLLIHK